MSRLITDAMRVTVPEGECDGLTVKRFTIGPDSLENLRQAIHGRGTRPGTYTALRDGHQLWMSDTDAEQHDHMPAVWAMARGHVRRVLINGLGLGMVLAVALALDHIEHVDVVEKDLRVIRLVGPHYACDQVTVHHADAYEQAKAWPPGIKWDVAWHDIWPDLCTDNLPQMTRLHRSYARRAAWQGSWGKTLLESMRRQERRAYGWGRP